MIEAQLQNKAIRTHFDALVTGTKSNRERIANQCYAKGLIAPILTDNPDMGKIVHTIQARITGCTGIAFRNFLEILRFDESTEYLADLLQETLESLRQSPFQLPYWAFHSSAEGTRDLCPLSSLGTTMATSFGGVADTHGGTYGAEDLGIFSRLPPPCATVAAPRGEPADTRGETYGVEDTGTFTSRPPSALLTLIQREDTRLFTALTHRTESSSLAEPSDSLYQVPALPTQHTAMGSRSPLPEVSAGSILEYDMFHFPLTHALTSGENTTEGSVSTDCDDDSSPATTLDSGLVEVFSGEQEGGDGHSPSYGNRTNISPNSEASVEDVTEKIDRCRLEQVSGPESGCCEHLHEIESLSRKLELLKVERERERGVTSSMSA